MIMGPEVVAGYNSTEASPGQAQQPAQQVMFDS